MATMKDIAERLGVSVSTVSKSLNGTGNVSESVRQQILDTALEMGYTPRRGSRAHTSAKICVFIENMGFE